MKGCGKFLKIDDDDDERRRRRRSSIDICLLGITVSIWVGKPRKFWECSADLCTPANKIQR